MSNGDFHCPPVTEDKDNTENLIPERDLGSSLLPKFPGKGGDSRKEVKSGAERQALTSLQLNTDCGSESLKSSNPLEFPPESKDVPSNTVLHSKQEDIPVQSIESEDTTSPSEEPSSLATAQSSADPTWKSCVDTPSPPVTFSDQYDTAEDLSNCSFEELSSSKEVSFNLPPGYSEWVQCASSDGQLFVHPTTNSVQTLSHIVTTVLENNPEICPENTSKPVSVDPAEADPEIVPTEVSYPSVASHILHRSGVLQESKNTPGLSESFSDLICKFSGLNVEDHNESLSTSVNNFSEPVAPETDSVARIVETFLPCSNSVVKEPGCTPSDCSVADCSSITESEVSPVVEASEDILSKPTSLTPAVPELQCDTLELPLDVPEDIQQFVVLNPDNSCGLEERHFPLDADENILQNPAVNSDGLCVLEERQFPADAPESVQGNPAVNSDRLRVLEEQQLSVAAPESVQQNSEVNSDHPCALEEQQLSVDEPESVPQNTAVNSDCPCALEEQQLPADEPESVPHNTAVNFDHSCALDEKELSVEAAESVQQGSAVNFDLSCISVDSLPQEKGNGEQERKSVEPDHETDVPEGASNSCSKEADEVLLNVELGLNEQPVDLLPNSLSVDDSSITVHKAEPVDSSTSALPVSEVQEALVTASTPNHLPVVDLIKEAVQKLETNSTDFKGSNVAVDQTNQDQEVAAACQLVEPFQQSVVSASQDLHVEAEEKLEDLEEIKCSQDKVDASDSQLVKDKSVTPVENQDRALADDVPAHDVDSQCTLLPDSDALNTTDALFLDFNLQGVNKVTPLKSLLDSTFTGDSEVNTNNQNRISSVSSTVTQPICPNSSEQVVLDVPAKASLDVLKETANEPCKLSSTISPVENTSQDLIAKDVASEVDIEEPKEPDTQFHQDSAVNILKDLPTVDTTELEQLVQAQNGVNCKVNTMPMHMMEAHLDHQWHQNDQVNSMVSDNNCDVDVNVNQCHPMQGNNYHHNDVNLKMVGQVNSGDSSVTSSPNKRKNDEDSAFEDLATVEDANSDLVDDHIMDDQVEEIGVAAVNRRSPSQTRISESSPKTKAVSAADGSTKASDLPALNHSEAGPVVAEFTEEELRATAEVFKDPSTFEFLERVSNSKAFEESTLSRLSLYVKFDPLVSKKSQESHSRSTFKKPVAPQKKSVPVGQEAPSRDEELIFTTDSSSPQVHRRELDAQKLIDFHSPNPPQVARANPKMVPVEPVQRIENMQQCKVFTEDDMKKAMKINELMFNERVIKKEKELAEAESKLKTQAEAAKEQNSVLQESLAFTRRLLEESGQMVRQWQEKKELERVEVTRERDQALEDLRSVEASFSELHRRYEKIKAVLEGYKQNEEGLRVQLLDTQDNLRKQEQMYEALKEHTQEKLESANVEIENAKKAGGSEIAVLRSQLMKAEMKVNSLEKSLEHKAQEYLQLTAIYDDLIARVSGGQ